jgi:hypothetical protein
LPKTRVSRRMEEWTLVGSHDREELARGAFDLLPDATFIRSLHHDDCLFNCPKSKTGSQSSLDIPLSRGDSITEPQISVMQQLPWNLCICSLFLSFKSCPSHLANGADSLQDKTTHQDCVFYRCHAVMNCHHPINATVLGVRPDDGVSDVCRQSHRME